ncbi:unnamed protein product, partial [Laminaria digitata]
GLSPCCSALATSTGCPLLFRLRVLPSVTFKTETCLPPGVTCDVPRQVTTSTGTTKTLNAPINFRQHHRRQPTLCRYRYQEHPRRRRKTASLPQDRVMTMRLVQ